MPKARRKCWSQSVGVYGSKVRVTELAPGGPLYLLWMERDGRQRKRALGHRERRLGREEALALANQLASSRDTLESGRLTLGRLIDGFMREGMHGRTEKHRREAMRKLQTVANYFGTTRAVESLSRSDVERYAEARRSGLHLAGGKSSAPVGQTTVWHDVVALKTALNWAVGHRCARGRPLLASNPLQGISVPKELNPARPVADDRYVRALRAVAPRMDPKFGALVELAHATGHRIDAILHLRWADVSFAASAEAPFGSIHWVAEHDKIGNNHVVPMNEAAQRVLLSVAGDRDLQQSGWIFPSPSDDTRPLDRHLASRWLRRAEALAGIPRERGRGWHSFRRGWASSRKHLPDVDVAAAGGWKDTSTMKRCYQHADAAGVLRAVDGAIPR